MSDEKPIEYWVVANDGTSNLTVPFRAMNKEHAERWINQGYVCGKYHITEREYIDPKKAQEELWKAAKAADYALLSLIACREGATEELLKDVQIALSIAVARYERSLEPGPP